MPLTVHAPSSASMALGPGSTIAMLEGLGAWSPLGADRLCRRRVGVAVLGMTRERGHYDFDLGGWAGGEYRSQR